MRDSSAPDVGESENVSTKKVNGISPEGESDHMYCDYVEFLDSVDEAVWHLLGSALTRYDANYVSKLVPCCLDNLNKVVLCFFHRIVLLRPRVLGHAELKASHIVRTKRVALKTKSIQNEVKNK
jgi:hypothetical protein